MLGVKREDLPPGFHFRYVETQLDGQVSRGRALTRFRPQGYATPSWIYLEDEDGNPYTVVVHPLGRAEIFDDFVQPE